VRGVGRFPERPPAAVLDRRSAAVPAEDGSAAVEARIAAGDLVEEAVDDHDVLKHYSDGADLVDDVGSSKRRFPDKVIPIVAAIEQPLVVRERCRLRRLRVR
jgi:hypothetical protein